MLFDSTDYRSALRALCEEKKKVSARYTLQNLAKACRVQKTYMSAVTLGRGHLNADQLYLAANFLKLEDAEYRFLEALQEYQKSNVEERRKVLSRKIEHMKRAHQQTEKHIISRQSSTQGEPGLTPYYLDPYIQLVHMFLTIPRFQKSKSRLARAAGLSEERVDGIVLELQRIGLVEITGNKIGVVDEPMHLPARSPLYQAYRTLIRQMSQTHLLARRSEQDYSFSAIFTGCEATRREFRTEFLQLLGKLQARAQSQDPENVYQINLDFLSWEECR